MAATVHWSGSTAYITGSSRGIGAAVARAAHARGARVGLISRTPGELEQLADELERHGGADVGVAEADVGDPAQVHGALAVLRSEIGPPDILVNNAGVGAYAAFLDEELETFERLMRVNYLGTVHTIREVLPGMVERQRGHIVNIASVAGLLGAPNETAYSSSKFAVVGLSEALAAEVASLGVGVSLVNPGPVATHFTEARGVEFQRDRPRPLRAEQVADAVMRAVDDDRFEQVLPRWLRFPTVIRAAMPQLFLRGVVRDTAKHASRATR
jgi:3-oxoacyl-[acyl-carrier protein] reductase